MTNETRIHSLPCGITVHVWGSKDGKTPDVERGRSLALKNATGKFVPRCDLTPQQVAEVQTWTAKNFPLHRQLVGL
jgi:hypothetical protein